MLEHVRRANIELEAWHKMFADICEQFGITKDELNGNEYKPMFNSILGWGDEYARLRLFQYENDRFNIYEQSGMKFSSRGGSEDE